MSQIFRIYYSDLHNYGIKLCGKSSIVEDTLQDMFLHLFEKREQLGQVSYIKPYLYTCFRRSLLKNIQAKRQMDLLDDDLQLQIEPEEIALTQSNADLKKKVLASMINKLPKRQRELIYLRYYSDFSIDEIADILSISYRSVVNTLYKAMIRLRSDKTALGVLEHLLIPIFGFSIL
nr:sigma-70 family RNA polymerase sigma factor [Membranihabitans marinus]